MSYSTECPTIDLSYIGINPSKTKYNCTPEQLMEDSITMNEGVISDKGALVVKTGKFTGRSPQDRFIVKDSFTEDLVDWNKINMPFDRDKFFQLRDKIKQYLNGKTVYVQDAYACADRNYSLDLRLVAELPWSAQFAHNMFRRLTEEELKTFTPEWHILCAPEFKADPEVDGTRSDNFAIISFEEKTIIIGGTGYTGEIKKGIFSVLNCLLPANRNVLAMHCSANQGMKEGDTAIFFGLSGTGKTTLSTDPNRYLIGDDEHGWSDEGVFNFEGGCYAKTIDLSAEKEPDIYGAIRHGAILENIIFEKDSRTPDYADASITQNTRVSYPIYHINNAKESSQGGNPKHIFFLTADAFGVLPPVSRLTKSQAMYNFISGYTAKVAGTEAGIDEPVATFSACFGAPFMPLHPTKYAEMLGDKMNKHNSKIWLINTGWTGGPYGVGNRISLKYTRAIITAILNDELNDAEYETVDTFGLHIPTSCPGVPSEILNPINTWADKDAYRAKAENLADLFNKNFEQFEDQASQEILAAAPHL